MPNSLSSCRLVYQTLDSVFSLDDVDISAEATKKGDWRSQISRIQGLCEDPYIFCIKMFAFPFNRSVFGIIRYSPKLQIFDPVFRKILILVFNSACKQGTVARVITISFFFGYDLVRL